MKRLAAVLMFAVSSGPALAQVQQETLADAVGSALDNNPSMMAQRRVRQDADEALVQARSSMLPSVGLSGTFSSRHTDVGEQFTTATGTFPRDGGSGYARAGLEARQSIYSGGTLTAQKRAARAGVDASEARLDSFEQSLILDVIAAYLDVRRAEDALRIRGANVDALRQQVQAAQDRFDVGEVTRTDIAQAQARAAGSDAAFALARSELAAARAQFENLVGRPAVQLSPPPSAPAVPATLDAAIVAALEANPDLQSARAEEAAAQQGVRVAKGDLMPKVDLVGRAGWTETRWDQTFRDTDSSIGAEVSIPLFSGGLLRSKTRSAQLRADQARFERMAVERGVTQQVTSAWHQLVAARQGIESSQAQVAAAEIALEGIQQELSVGERITLDVLDQEQELLEARLALIDAQRGSYLAAHELLATVGDLSATSIAR